MAKSKYRWSLSCGAIILKYRMTSSTIEYLRYEKGQPLEYGDYASYNSLKEAKQGFKTKPQPKEQQ